MQDNIGCALRELRGNKSRKEVADAVGISVSSLGMIEQGRRIPRDQTKIALANYFGTSVEKIFYQKSTQIV